jgi:hypothetical protein
METCSRPKTTSAGAAVSIACPAARRVVMIRRLKSGEYRLFSTKKSAATGRRRNLGTFKTLEAAKQHEREIQYFKRH